MLALFLAVACRSEPPPYFVRATSDAPATEAVAAPPPRADADGDGFPAEEDCDDRDPAVHPGALERCNDVDDACDGGTDDGAVSVVGGHAYETLADALATAPVGSEVRVCPGRYLGPFTVPRALLVSASGGPDATLLDGGGSARVLSIRADGVEVRGFTITGGASGYEVDGGGGGVYVAPYVDAAMTDVVITGNATDGDGGGLLLDTHASLVLEGDVVGNAAQDGGGAWLRSGATLTGGSVAGNTSVVGGGAGLEADAALVAVHVEDNFASAGGGGVYVVGNARLEDVSVRANACAWQGGGLSVQLGTLWLDGNTLVVGNSAGHAGGGLDLYEATVIGGTIQDNSADRLGGGVYGTSSAVLGATIALNDAEHGGGVATEAGGVELDDVVVSANQAVLGGGIYAGSIARVSSSSILENEAVSGGALYVARGGAIELSDNDLGAGAADNAPDDIAVENGGGLQAQAGALYCDAYGCW